MMIHSKLFAICMILSCVFLADFGFSQSRRVIGIIPFDNKSADTYDWLSRGIEEILYDKFGKIREISVYERETLIRLLREKEIYSSQDVSARKAFSLGKTAGIEVLMTGNYTIANNAISVNYRLISTYTGSAIFEKDYSAPIHDLFTLFEGIIFETADILDVNVSNSEANGVRQRLTQSLAAFEYYCKAYVEIGKGLFFRDYCPIF